VLLAVALIMPSLLVLARTPPTPPSASGWQHRAAVSVSWMLERATRTAVDPFEGLQTWLVEHPLLLAVLAMVARGADPRGAPAAPAEGGVAAGQRNRTTKPTERSPAC
jgi:hypothetical protein